MNNSTTRSALVPIPSLARFEFRTLALSLLALLTALSFGACPALAQRQAPSSIQSTESIPDGLRQQLVDQDLRRFCFCPRFDVAHLAKENLAESSRNSSVAIDPSAELQPLRQCCSFQETGVELVPKGVWGGLVKTVFVDEAVNPDRVYIGSGRRLVLLNVTDNGAGGVDIVEIGSIDLGSVVEDIKVRGNYAYVATKGKPSFFSIVNISNPTQPLLVFNSAGTSFTRPRDVELFGNFAYVQDGVDLRLVDIADPENAQVLGTAIQSIVEDVVIVGDRLYIVTSPKEIRVYDVTNPALTFLGSTPIPGADILGTAIAVEGDHAYATVAPNDPALLDSTVSVIDVLDPTNPTVESSFDGFHFATDVAVSNGYAFIADWAVSSAPVPWQRAGGIVVYDVGTNPAAPTIVGSYKPHGTVSGVEVVGTRAYVMDEGEGMVVLDVSNPATPTFLGNYHSPANLRQMDKQGDLLYLTDAWNGLTVLDVADPLNPTLVGVHQSPLSDGTGVDHWAISVNGTTAYMAAGYGGLELLDVSNPLQPVLAGAFRLDDPSMLFSRGLGQSGNVISLGVATPSGAVMLNLDTTAFQSIAQVGSLFLFGTPLDIELFNPNLCHIANDLQHSVIDNQNFNQPVQIGTGPGKAVGVGRIGNFVYIADRDVDETVGGLLIQDVSDPTNPVQVARVPAKRGRHVDVDASRAYFAGQDPNNQFRETLFAVDVSNPLTPSVLDTVVVPEARVVHVDGGHVYVTGKTSGLAIFKKKILGDINCDGLVNLADYDQFNLCLAGPLQPAAPACLDSDAADCDADGDVDMHDFAMFSGMFDGS